MTQSQFNDLPSVSEPVGVVDYEAMRQDPYYIALQAVKENRAAYLAQQQ
jgi:hypothetical protein